MACFLTEREALSYMADHWRETMKLLAKLCCGLIVLSVALVGLGGVAAAESSPVPHNPAHSFHIHLQWFLHIER
jgi:hypothetical protein